jgi:DNA phosphorothioation system restriction enzyme
MSLIDLQNKLRISYRTGRDNLVRDFYIPCLEQSVLYRRAVGYFTSRGLALAASGVASLVTRCGKMQLVASPYLEETDLEALQRASQHPEDVLRNIVSRSLADIEDLLTNKRLNALAWLVADGALEVRLALRVDAQDRFMRGIYHEKVGIFSDSNGNHVAFSGSPNETAGGLVDNFESIKVFWSWDDPQKRIAEDLANFEDLWSDRTPGLRIVEFTEISRGLLERFKQGYPMEGPDELVDYIFDPPPSRPGTIPLDLELRDYQKEAIRSWLQRNGRGILAMATGTGKTVTALYLACKVYEKNCPLLLVIVCPFINLCHQWLRELTKFGLHGVACFEGKDSWQVELEEAYQSLITGLEQIRALVVTNATFQSDTFQRSIRPRCSSGTVHHLLIADEVHNLGAQHIKNVLPDTIDMRLGLSATPERHFDAVGTALVLEYFGGVIYEYPISRAIADGYLSPYRYYPVPVDLTDDEANEYEELTTKLSRLLHGSEEENELNPPAMRLLIKRARLVGAAYNKQIALDHILSSLQEPPRKAIFYCGDGRTTDVITDDEARQIKAVSRILGEKHDLRVRNFTYRESSTDREDILRDLESGFLDGVVAIRCLDEGIDLPDLRMGFLLASSTNPRQFIQRRGRLLRKSPGKKRALIYDFFVRPPDYAGRLDDDAFNLERSFFQRELRRIVEFCRMAENGPEALHTLLDLRQKYNLISE